jgi:hypothetical protein
MKKIGYRARCHRLVILLALVLPLLAVLILSTPVLAAPLVTLNPVSGACGTKVTINGTVFDSYKGDDIYIYFDEKEIAGSPLTVPATGTFSILFTIPDETAPGTHRVGIKSEVGSTKFLAEALLQVEPVALNLDVTQGQVGTGVTISGNGFYAERAVTLYYQNMSAEKIGSVTASPTGGFSHGFVIPDSTGGAHRIMAVNDKGNGAEATFTVIPMISPGVDSAGPGQLINVSTDDYGNFDIDFEVPDVKPGAYDIRAQDDKGNLDSARFSVTAGASLSQTTGPVGGGLTICGDGFSAGQAVTVNFDDQPVATTMADNNGTFTVTFNVPASAGGSHTITISDGTTSRQFAFGVESEAPPVPALLLPASASESQAQAYLAWRDVTDASLPVTYNLQLSSDANFGSLVLEKKGLTGPEYILTTAESLRTDSSQTTFFWRVNAVDAARNVSEWSAPWSFYVSAPPVPELLTPSFNSIVELPLHFTWRSVNSLGGPVDYSLHVSRDPDFMSTLLEKTGLTLPEYAVTEEDKLELKKGKDYYWRVKAVDRAGNESDWSASGSFNRGSSFHFPGWAAAILIIIGVIAVAILAFRAGRRSAYQIPGPTLY